MNRAAAKDFYEIQKERRAWSLTLFGLLILFYAAALGFLFVALNFGLGLIFPKPHFLSARPIGGILVVAFGFALLIALFTLYDARKNGAPFILKRLSASPPDLDDRYHCQFADVLDEIRIAAGLGPVRPYILPDHAVNSLALIEPDGTPCVAVTEGILAELTRDELQAVAAHELAHITRGDTFYLTLVCSIAEFFDRLRDALNPADDDRDDFTAEAPTPFRSSDGTSFSSSIVLLLSLLFCRERELLADAAAVEICRNPLALARAVYKAYVKNSFVGDFRQTYSPLFIVAPRTGDEDEDGWEARFADTHPPLSKRIEILAAMANVVPEEIARQVLQNRELRETSKATERSFEETHPGGPMPADGPEPKAAPDACPAWQVARSHGTWEGPFTLEELLFHQGFGPLVLVKNIHEGVEAPAREFPQIREALLRIGRLSHVDDARKNKCPKCGVPLSEGFYEGVPIRSCPKCTGKLVREGTIPRILARTEVGFSDELRRKAGIFRARFLRNPTKRAKIDGGAMGRLYCPDCGYPMRTRPFNYQYFIPVDKCLSCSKIWFDADELEILQILIEEAVSNRAPAFHPAC